jgi:uncharacterized protein (DUF952 family)
MSSADALPTLFHITTAAEWEAALHTGSYTGSTRGQSLAEVGFIHCSFAEQTPDIVATIYRDCPDPLVLLEIDPQAVGAEIRIEPVEGTNQAFPHIYGPLPTTAVREVQPLN